MTTDALIIKGDCLNVMAGLPDGSIDAIVTDPPYGLGFMGKNWDHSVPGEAFWREALRVAKPGCHLLAAGGSRTYHRLACAIEDAGWEIRDCIMWLYGSGFPKSLDVSKAIDKAAGAEREVVGKKSRTYGDNPASGGNGSYGNTIHGIFIDRRTDHERMDITAAATTTTTGAATGGRRCCTRATAPATDAAKQWQGWGTALKPAFEPFILARKPLDGTVAENVLTHGTGGINVDGCRIAHNGEKLSGGGAQNDHNGWGKSLCGKTDSARSEALGRWPANVIHDGSDEVVAGFEGTEKYNRPGKGPRIKQSAHSTSQHLSGLDTAKTVCFDDSGSAARFFYCAKASKADRDEGCEGLIAKRRDFSSMGTQTDEGIKHRGRNPENQNAPVRNHHPTVKPIDLMRYLCRLVTPPGGLILDPFCGSGSTGVAAMREGFNFIGIELNAEYAEIARRRIGHERNKTPLFSEVI